MRKFLNSMGFLIAAVALSAAPPLRADDAAGASAPASQDEIGEIVVTANKRQQSINDVGISITALTGDSMTELGITSPIDLGKVVPGLTVQPSPFNTPVYTLRGIGFYETTLSAAPTVAVYTDEVALPFAATTRGAGLDIERVEVLKGPQGTLFGQNTTGGAINYVANKPTDQFTAGSTVSLGRFSTFDVQGYLSGPLSDNVKVRIAARTLQSGPWQYSYTRSDKLGDSNFTQYRALVDFKVSDSVKLSFNLNGWRDFGDTQAAQLIADDCGGSTAGTCGSPDAAKFKNYPRSPADPQAADWGYGIFGRRPARHDIFTQGSLRADWEINSNVTLTSITAWSTYTTDSVQDFDGSIYASADTNTTGDIHNIAQELRLGGKYEKLNFIVGANYNKANVYDRLFYNFSQGPSSNPLYMIPNAPRGELTYNDSQQDVKDVAEFFNADYEIVPRLTIVGGARHTSSKRSFEGCTHDYGGGTATWWNAIFGTHVPEGGCITLDAALHPIVPALFNNLDESNVSWNVGLNYKLDAGTLLYSRVSKGFKEGSFPTASVASYTGYTPVHQESVLAYEVGVKAPLADHSVELTGAFFFYDYKDKQLRGRLPDPVFGTLDGLVQIPKSREWGFEASVQARPINGLTVSLGGTYIDTRVQEFVGYDAFGKLDNFSGQKFPYAPKVTITGDVEYKFPVSTNAKAYFGVNALHDSDTSTALANTTTATVNADPRFDVKAYTLVDLRAGAEFPNSHTRLGIYVRNVGNQYYWTNVQDTLASIVRYAGMPRTYGVQFSWQY